MGKQIFILRTFLPLFFAFSCGSVCEPGETQTCLCQSNTQGTQSCADDGFSWAQCNCNSISGGDSDSDTDSDSDSDTDSDSDSDTDSDSDSDTDSDSDSDTDSDSDADGDSTPDSLIEFFPECAASYIDNCNFDEVKIPCTNLCWRRCMAGEEFDGEICSSYSWVETQPTIVEKCKEYDPGYRLPTLNEIAMLLGNCDLTDILATGEGYCPAYETSAMKYVLAMSYPENVIIHYMSSWLGELDWCEDEFGQTTKGCVWWIRMIGESLSESHILWLRGNSNTLSNGMCVRES